MTKISKIIVLSLAEKVVLSEIRLWCCHRDKEMMSFEYCFRARWWGWGGVSRIKKGERKGINHKGRQHF